MYQALHSVLYKQNWVSSLLLRYLLVFLHFACEETDFERLGDLPGTVHLEADRA